jgi:hypothetical protein
MNKTAAATKATATSRLITTNLASSNPVAPRFGTSLYHEQLGNNNLKGMAGRLDYRIRCRLISGSNNRNQPGG